ncbi:MAG: pilus assembly protein TadG-related protein [Pseudomonadota bacterium]
MRRFWRGEGGGATVYAALTMPVLLAIGGAAVDSAWVRLHLAKLQISADAAALAGAAALPAAGPARAAALDYAARNINAAALAPGDVVLGNWDGARYRAGVSPTNAVRVTTRRASANANALPRFFGIVSADLSASAIAHRRADPCIDLEDFALGTKISDQIDGVTISVEARGRGKDIAMVFDTANPTGGDHDLASDTRGKVLIISEDGDSSDPDDNAAGGKFIFEFDEPVSIQNLIALDTETGGTMSAYDEAGDLVRREPIPKLPDGTEAVVDMTAEDVRRLVINLTGSGAFDDFCFGVGSTTLALVR